VGSKVFQKQEIRRIVCKNSDGGISAHSELGKYLETHLGVPEDKQLPETLCSVPHVIVGDEAFL